MRKIDKLAGLDAGQQPRAETHFERIPAYVRDFFAALGEARAMLGEVRESRLRRRFA